MRITSLVRHRLHHSGLFGPLLRLSLLGGMTFSSFYHLFALMFPFPLMVDRVSSERLGGWVGGWRGGRLSLGCTP